MRDRPGMRLIARRSNFQYDAKISSVRRFRHPGKAIDEVHKCFALHGIRLYARRRDIRCKAK